MKDTEFKAKLAELAKIIADHKDKPMPKEIADTHDALFLDIKAEQDDRDRKRQSAKLLDDAKQIDDPAAPGDQQDDVDESPEGKAAAAVERKQKVVGYVSLGAFAALQKSRQKWTLTGKDNQSFEIARVKDLRNPLVGLNREQMREFKAIPVIGADVIEPTRVDAVRVTEHDFLTLRSILNISRTQSDAVKYTRIVSYSRAAAPVVEGAAKPQAALELDSRTAPVETIAVWIPVQNQQIDDLAQLQNIIDTELLYDLDKAEEEQVMYGIGTGSQFLGICNDPDVLEMRVVGGDTLIDSIRRGITDVVVDGHRPNGITIDPLDWENIVLQKGSDLRYIVQVMVTAEGEHRLWGVPVIETVGMRDHTGAVPEERNVVVGDFLRGATLWDRQDSAITTGWINDQFIKNQRTILAERREAFAVRRPRAFRKLRTQEASAS